MRVIETLSVACVGRNFQSQEMVDVPKVSFSAPLVARVLIVTELRDTYENSVWSERDYEYTICGLIRKPKGFLVPHFLQEILKIGTLEDTMRVVHEGKRQFECFLCCKNFSYSAHLNRHVRI